MKKSIRIAALVAAATLAAGALVAPTANAAIKVKAAIAYDIGGRGDKSFNDSAAAGLDMAKKKFGVTVKEVTVTQGTDSEREDKLRLLAKAGYTPIVAVGYLYAGPLKKVAAEFPKTQFAIIDDESVALPNVSSLVFTEEQGSYLVGVAAALQSVTGDIGYIGGVRTPLLQKFEAGFRAGVKATDKNATVDVKYISEPPDYSGFNDPAKAKIIANGMIDKGVDVIYTAAGGSGAGTFAAAADAGKYGNKIWTIGVDSDQYLTGSAADKKNMLTSMLKRVDNAVFDVIAAASAGKKVTDALGGGVVGRRYSLKTGGIAVSYSGGYINQYKSKIDAAAKAIIAGKIKVPTKPAK
ncbi:unannotated protein [freshwater metagenome]|uniref:Unannotated protein n=1 Tax=freshwater metagenome TaxID=449393 RepID=A0A6J7GSJ3_9ZZZZ|nr:BMP family ABC transporter substrate-binding protein [Actinomycetota bacterium]